MPRIKIDETQIVKGWHVAPDDMRMLFSASKIKIGKWQRAEVIDNLAGADHGIRPRHIRPIRDDEPPRLCYAGMHASVRLVDAVNYRYSYDFVLCRVSLGGLMDKDDDKIAAQFRYVHWAVPLGDVACHAAYLSGLNPTYPRFSAMHYIATRLRYLKHSDPRRDTRGWYELDQKLTKAAFAVFSKQQDKSWQTY